MVGEEARMCGEELGQPRGRERVLGGNIKRWA